MRRRESAGASGNVILTLMAVSVILILLTIGVCAVRYLELQTRMELHPRRYSEIVSRCCTEFSLPEDVVYAVIKTESGFRADALSSAGAMGLMQLTEDTFEWIAGKLKEPDEIERVWDPSVNIRYGCYYLNYLYQRFGHWDIVFAAYNAGPNRVSGWLEDPEISENGMLVNIPYPETANYVKKIAAARTEYFDLYYAETASIL